MTSNQTSSVATVPPPPPPPPPPPSVDGITPIATTKAGATASASAPAAFDAPDAGTMLAPTPARPASAFVPPEQQPLAPPTVDPDVELSPQTLIEEGYIERRAGLSRLPKVPFELFAAIVIGAILLGAAALSNRDSRTNAEALQRIAEARLGDAEEDGTAMAETNASLADTNDILEAEMEQLEADLEATAEAEAAVRQELEDMRDVPEFDPTPLEDEIEELTTANAELLERAETAEAALEAAPASGGVTPAFFQYVGERLSASGLSADQAQCLGAAIIGDIGVEGFGAGAYTDQTTATNDALIDSMAAGAATCGIDTAIVFGS